MYILWYVFGHRVFVLDLKNIRRIFDRKAKLGFVKICLRYKQRIITFFGK
jgi:hypothetical protein